jgi:hypothetical protein
MDQYVQIAGAILVLLGYVLGQLGKIDTRAKSYLLINLLGSALLAIDAFDGRQWGFLVLNGTWAIISLVNLARALRDNSQTDGNVA